MIDAADARRRGALRAEISRVVPGLYAWLATVAAPVSKSGVSPWSRASAALALASLAASFVLGGRPRLARALGIQGFLLFCFGAWASLGPALRSDQIDHVRGALGAVGFLLHALAWGASPKEAEPEAAEHFVPGSPLQPRSKPPRLGALALGLGLALALLPIAAAFTVERPGASLLAHALGLASGLLLVSAGSDIAVLVGRPREFPPWRLRAARATWSLAGLALALGVLLIWLALQ